MSNSRPLLLLLLFLAAAGAASADKDWMAQLQHSMSSLPKELATRLQADATKLKRKVDGALGQLPHRPSPFEIADRPTGHGHQPSPFEIADRPTGHGRRPSPFEIADRPTGHGRRPSPFEIADRPTRHGRRPVKIVHRPGVYKLRPYLFGYRLRHGGFEPRRVSLIRENIFYRQVCWCGAGPRGCSRHYKPAFYVLVAVGCLLTVAILAFVISAVVAAVRRRRQRAAVLALSSGGRRLLGSGLSVQCDPVMASVYGQKIQKVAV